MGMRTDSPVILNSRTKSMAKTIFPAVLFFLFIVCFEIKLCDAREMKAMKRIATPKIQMLDLPENAKRADQTVQVDRNIIKHGIDQMTRTWNSPKFSNMISDSFYDKSRLNMSMAGSSQYNTTLKLESMENIQVMDQYVITNPDGSRVRVSKVSAVARTRSEFEDSSAGKVSSPGTNEIIFEVKEKIIGNPDESI